MLPSGPTLSGSGRYGTAKRVPLSRVLTHPAARDVKVADELLGYCAELADLELPR